MTNHNNHKTDDVGNARVTLAGLSALIVIIIIFTYHNAVPAGFFSDDYTWLARMPATVRHVPYIFTVFYRDFNPVLHFSYMVDYLLGGGDAVAYHVTSLLIHAANAVLLFLLCRRLGAGPWVAFGASLLWSLDSRLSEPVIWAAARGHSLAVLFVLAAFYVLTFSSRAALWLGALLFFIGLFAKETALFPMPLLPLLMSRRFRRWPHLLPFGILAVAFIIFNILAKPSVYLSSSPASQLALKIPFILLRPLGLGDYYHFNWMFFIVILLAFAVGACILRHTLALPGFIWLAVCMIPIVPLDKLSSRYLYLPSIGYALIFCGLCRWISTHVNVYGMRRIIIAGGAVVIVLMGSVNLIFIQGEIEDYTFLSHPYSECLDMLRAPALALQPGMTLLVGDVSPRSGVRQMVEMIRSRGHSMKLIPPRSYAIGGLLVLRDAVNITRRGENGWFAVTTPPARGPRVMSFIYDGQRVFPAEIPPDLPTSRIFAARLESPATYFADDKIHP